MLAFLSIDYFKATVMMHRTALIGLVAALSLGGATWAGDPTPVTATPTTPGAPCPLPPMNSGVETMYADLIGLMDSLDRMMPEVTAPAEAAAKQYVEHADWGVGVDGDDALMSELVGRAGSVMAMGGWWPMEGLKKGWKGVMLYGLRENLVDQTATTKLDVDRISLYKQAGCPVYVIGSAALIARAKMQKSEADGWIIIPDPMHPQPGVSMYSVSMMAYGIAWEAEFVGACSRMGKTPVMFQSIMVPTGRDRIKKYTLPKHTTGDYQKFHEDMADLIKGQACKPGYLAGEWVAQTRETLKWIHENQMDAIRQAARKAVDTKTAGHKLYWSGNGHGINGVMESQDQWSRDIAKIGEGDLFLFLGYDRIPNTDEDKHLADTKIRAAHASAIWVCTSDYHPDEAKPGPGEILIDTHWKFGDAVVTWPGYDIKILPSSGILTGGVFLMIEAQIKAIEVAGK